jgi:NitT/TauT family transport system ATP-binding protein
VGGVNGKLELRGVAKDFKGHDGTRRVLDAVDLQVAPGEFICVVGASGSGKSTLLSLIAGLSLPTEGEILLDGEVVTGPGPERGLVFQTKSLYPWRTVERNVASGLELVRLDKAERNRRVAWYLAEIGLTGYEHALPRQLSGGQQQRVALARALACEPEVLLLDEPFGALDARVRKQLRQWLRRLHDEVKVTTILVTHDSEEACEVADRVAVMHEARIAQIGTAAELARSSANPFLESFLAESTRTSGGSKKINFH